MTRTDSELKIFSNGYNSCKRHIIDSFRNAVKYDSFDHKTIYAFNKFLKSVFPDYKPLED